MPDASSPASAEERLIRYREKLVEAAALALPLSLIAAAHAWMKDRLFDEPWKILWILLPLAAATCITWRALRKSGQSRLDWRWFIFLGLFCSLFALASTSELLVWKRLPRSGGHYDHLHEETRGWAVPVWLGDWRYRLVQRVPSHLNNVAVLLLDAMPEASKERLRVRDRRMIELARMGGARGIAFDVAYEGSTSVDPLFCSAVARAERERKGFRVLSAYDLTPADSDSLPRRPPTSETPPVLPCLPVSTQGHAMGFAEGDGVVRSIPLNWEREDAPAFSVRVAELMRTSGAGHSKLSLPAGELLRFIPPSTEIHVKYGQQVRQIENSPGQLQGYFLIVGERSDRDTFKTPFGTLPGAVVHAYAIHSLLSGSHISRPPALWCAFVVFAGCYLLTLLAARGSTALQLVSAACVLTAIIMLSAAAVVYFWSVWLDVIYAIAAIWLLLPMLIAMRRVLVPRDRAEPLRRPEEAELPSTQARRTGAGWIAPDSSRP